MKKPRIVLADDHQIVVDGLRGLLGPGFEIVATAKDGRQLVEIARKERPDAIVTDISMPLLNGIDAVRRLREEGVEAKVVFLTMHPDPVYASRALDAGGSGYVVKHSAAEELVDAIRAALRGDTWISPAVKSPAVDELLDETKRRVKETIELTPRQREIVQLLAEGKSAKEVGGLLGISPRTVETHKYKIMDDLGLKTTAQLVQYAIRHGLAAGAAPDEDP
jgi:DNA-binding NarL/FixJ family response regulator